MLSIDSYIFKNCFLIFFTETVVFRFEILKNSIKWILRL